MRNLIIESALMALVVLAISCETSKKEGLSDKDSPQEKIGQLPITPFEKSLAFHGGLETWNSYGTLKFERISERGIATHIIDLKNRNEKISNENNTIAFASDGFWTDAKDEETRSGLSRSRFQRNLWFYFFGLSFVTADPGANQEQITDGILKGKKYDRVKITFGEGVGDAPDDQYILWLNKSTGQLKMINYSVTYGKGKSASENYNAIVFTEWQEANDLKVPKMFKGYAWQNDSLGELRYQFEFDNVSFDTQRPAISTFETPKNAAFLNY